MITYLACHIYVVTNTEIVQLGTFTGREGPIVREATAGDVHNPDVRLGAIKDGAVIPLSEYERRELRAKYPSGALRQAIEVVRTVATCPSWSPSQHARAA